MRKGTQSGICHICRSDGPLSFEHVPPKSAFNDKPIVWRVGRDALDNLPSARGQIKQKGAGAYTLCPTCNNKTGGWYGSAYAKWAYQGMDLVEYAKRDPHCMSSAEVGILGGRISGEFQPQIMVLG